MLPVGGEFGSQWKAVLAVTMRLQITLSPNFGASYSVIPAAFADLVPTNSGSYSNVTASDITAPYFARHVGHLSGCDVETPALTVNR
jgi:hypothetical protein